MKNLAILILNYNGKHFLKRCISSLNKQTKHDFDTWLIDNNSFDGSREFVKNNFPNVRILNTEANRGFAGAYNYACKYFDKKKLTYNYYQLLNNDTECDSVMVEKILETFKLKNNIGIVVPAVVNESMTIDALGGTMLPITGTTLGYSGKRKFKRGNSIYQCFWASGCAFCIKSKLFKGFGYFNDYFMYFEDVDISWKVNNSGRLVVGIDSTYVKHWQGGSKAPSEFVLYLNERNRILSYWQNLPTSLFVLMFPFLLVSRILLLFYLSNNLGNVFGKIRGIKDGILLIPRYKKTIFTFDHHINTIKMMPKVIKL